MLSILIPVWRYDCSTLVGVLCRQADAAGIVYELILGDDASGDDRADCYAMLARQYPAVSVYKSDVNIGAGRMRNTLAARAIYPMLLILDSDVLPADDNFLSRYLAESCPGTVVYGGFIYAASDRRPNNELRYRYGMEVELRSLSERCNDPYRSFVAMAMLIPQDIMINIGFPKDMGMGYEDAYFGYLLRRAGIPVKHIDNPVRHRLKESSREYLATTRRYIDNLYLHRVAMRPAGIRLLEVYYRIDRLGCRPIFRLAWRICHSRLENMLCRTDPDLRLYALYKLFYLCSLT